MLDRFMTLIIFIFRTLLIIVPRAYLPLLEFLWLLVAVLVAVTIWIMKGRSRFGSMMTIVHPVRVVNVPFISWTVLVPVISIMVAIWLEIVLRSVAHASPILLPVGLPVTMNHPNDLVWHVPIKQPGMLA